MSHRIQHLALAAVLTVAAAACTDATPTDLAPSEARVNGQGNGAAPAAPTIVDIAAGNPDFSILVEALEAADLKDALNGKRQFTVFAPTNAAFADLLALLGVTKEELFDNESLLEQVLLYHVAPGERFSGDVLDSKQIRTLQGGFVFPIASEGEFFIVDGDANTSDARLLAAEGLIDIDATNGVVHVIDQVLVPGEGSAPGSHDDEDGDDDGDDDGDEGDDQPTITELVESFAEGDDAEFTILLAALEETGLDDALDGDRQFTVFAPTDAAFVALLGALSDATGSEVTAADLLARDDLADILLYHVLPGERFSGDVLDSETLVTVNGAALTPEIRGEDVFIIDGSPVTMDAQLQIDAGLIDVDVANGVVHVIDQVLLPM